MENSVQAYCDDENLLMNGDGLNSENNCIVAVYKYLYILLFKKYVHNI